MKPIMSTITEQELKDLESFKTELLQRVMEPSTLSMRERIETAFDIMYLKGKIAQINGPERKH